MKTKKINRHDGRRALILIAVLAVFGALAVATAVTYGKLRDLWVEQCVITDPVAQIEITAGRRLKPDTVRELFGLREGANLALIDFAAKREEALKRYPVIKSISVERRLPSGVGIAIIEREPFAKIRPRDAKQPTGLVCDEEGVVFSCRRGAEMLPVIREAASGVHPGERLEGRGRAALEVLKAAREGDCSNLTILEIDSTKSDYLLITLSNYSAVKFRWEGMEKPSPSADAAMRSQLRKVAQTIAANLQPGTRIWNATQPDIISGDLNGRN